MRGPLPSCLAHTASPPPSPPTQAHFLSALRRTLSSSPDSPHSPQNIASALERDFIEEQTIVAASPRLSTINHHVYPAGSGTPRRL